MAEQVRSCHVHVPAYGKEPSGPSHASLQRVRTVVGGVKGSGPSLALPAGLQQQLAQARELLPADAVTKFVAALDKLKVRGRCHCWCWRYKVAGAITLEFHCMPPTCMI